MQTESPNPNTRPTNAVVAFIGGTLLIIIGWGVLLLFSGMALEVILPRGSLAGLSNTSQAAVLCFYPTLVTPFGFWVAKTKEQSLRIVYLWVFTGLLPGYIILYGWSAFHEGLSAKKKG